MVGSRYSAQASVSIHAPAERVWEALVTPTIVAQYLHGTTMEADWRPGGTITWSGEWKGEPYVDRGSVLEYEPPRRLATTHWSPMSGLEDRPENYHHVSYDVEERDGVTTLTLTHGNSPTQTDADAMVENSWKPVLQEIKDLVESRNARG